MAPKHALLSGSGSGPGAAGVNNRGEPCSSPPAARMAAAGTAAACSPGNGKRTRAPDGLPARRMGTVGAVLMLMLQSSLAARGKTPIVLSSSNLWSDSLFLIILKEKKNEITPGPFRSGLNSFE